MFWRRGGGGFPTVLFDELNGGVNLLRRPCRTPSFLEGEMYILGGVLRDCPGRYINLYYGSFAALAEKEDWDRETWREELVTTLSHELTHHMESRGGLHALDDRDAEELAQWRQEYGLDRKGATNRCPRFCIFVRRESRI